MGAMSGLVAQITLACLPTLLKHTDAKDSERSIRLDPIAEANCLRGPPLPRFKGVGTQVLKAAGVDATTPLSSSPGERGPASLGSLLESGSGFD